MTLKLLLAVLASALPMTAVAAQSEHYDLICAGEGWTEFKGTHQLKEDISVDLKTGQVCYLPCKPGQAEDIQSITPETLVFYEDEIGSSRMIMALDRKTLVYSVTSMEGEKVLRRNRLTCKVAPFTPFPAGAD